MEIAEAVTKIISAELDRDDSEFIVVHRQCAEFAVKFVKVAIENLTEQGDHHKR